MEQVEYYMFKVHANTLKNPKKDIFDRIEAMVYLKEEGSLDAIDALIKGFKKETQSDVLRHEICYYIGQMGTSQEHIDKIQAFFAEEVCKEHTKFVLHEIVESMGNINHENSITLLERFREEKDAILFESCYIAKRQMEWKKATENGKTEGLDMAKLRTQSQNPSPPFNYLGEPKYADITFLKQMLLNKDNKYDFFDRYRALFTLRELESEEAVEAMCQAMTKEARKTCSDLIRHEIAFLVRQMPDHYKPALPYFIDCLNDKTEAPIVRHEILVTLGMLIHDKELVLPYLDDPDFVVAQSCEIAIGLIEDKLRAAQQAESKSDENDNYGEEDYNEEAQPDEEDEPEAEE